MGFGNCVNYYSYKYIVRSSFYTDLLTINLRDADNLISGLKIRLNRLIVGIEYIPWVQRRIRRRLNTSLEHQLFFAVPPDMF